MNWQTILSPLYQKQTTWQNELTDKQSFPPSIKNYLTKWTNWQTILSPLYQKQTIWQNELIDKQSFPPCIKNKLSDKMN